MNVQLSVTVNKCSKIIHSYYIILNVYPKAEDYNMIKKEIATGFVHKVPADLQQALTTTKKAQAVWNTLTPLVRNEWICWVTSVKKPETRKHHIERVCTHLLEGKHRPCCWPGCPHRNPNAKKWFEHKLK